MEKVRMSELGGAYAFLDPAGGKTGWARLGRTLARSAIVVVAEDQDRRIFVLEAWARRCPTTELIAEVLRVNQQWRVRKFGVEANAMQSLFAESLKVIGGEQHTRVPIVPVVQHTRIEKTFRIRAALQPIIGPGRLIVASDQVELKNELKAFPRGQTVDLVDALASCVTLLPEIREEVRDREAGDDLARYLRQEGVSGPEIERRMARFYRDEMAGRMMAETNGA